MLKTAREFLSLKKQISKVKYTCEILHIASNAIYLLPVICVELIHKFIHRRAKRLRAAPPAARAGAGHTRCALLSTVTGSEESKF